MAAACRAALLRRRFALSVPAQLNSGTLARRVTISMRAGNVRTRSPHLLVCSVFATLVVFWPSSAHADAGVPMLALMWPSAWALFFPVCMIEALVARRSFGLPFLQCAKLSFVANAWSTLVGIPLTWLALLLLEFAGGAGASLVGPKPGAAWLILSPIFAAWLGPGAQRWHVFAAAAFLCVPFMLVSIRVESWSAAKRIPREDARRWARLANFATYLPIVAILLALAISARLHTP